MIGLALDARKPVSTFAKLVVDRNTSGESVRSLRERAHETIIKQIETWTMQGKHGLLLSDHVNMFAWFYYCASVSMNFFLLMKLAMESACGGILRLCLYTDEVVRRNKLRPDMGGKYQAV